MLTNPSANEWRKRPRVPRDPTQRFKQDLESQLNGVDGCPELQLEDGHFARRVLEFVCLLGAEDLGSQYSALLRRGYRPDRVRAVLVHGSLIGLHRSTKLDRACQTDAALRWLAGGWRPSATTLRRFRLAHAEFFEEALAKTVAIANERGLLDVEGLSVDSNRLRAHATMHEVRTETRSKNRLQQLETSTVDPSNAETTRTRDAKIQKHRDALELLEWGGRANPC